MKLKAGSTRAAPGTGQSKAGFSPTRRQFLKNVAALAATGGVAAASGGCIALPLIGEAANSSKKEQISGAPFGSRLPKPRSLPRIKKDWKLLVKNSHLLTPREAVSLNALHEEWDYLSDFMCPNPLSPGSGISGLQQLVFPVSNGVVGGSGTLITPRHVLTAAHVLDYESGSPRIPLSYNPTARLKACISPSTATIWQDLDLALLTLSPGAMPTDGSVPLARLHSGGPIFGSRVQVLGYPNRERSFHGHGTSLIGVRGATTWHSSETGRFFVKSLGEEHVGAEKSIYLKYGEEGIPSPAGISGGPIASSDGKIFGAFIEYNYRELWGIRPHKILLAAGLGAIRTIVTSYLIESVATPIRNAAEAIREKL